MRFTRIVPAFAIALVAGCSGDSTEPIVDVDAALTQMATSGISTYSTAAATASIGGISLPAPSSSASSCSYNSGLQFFVCAPVTASGLTFSRQFQLLDAAGAPLATANPLLVAAIRSVIDVEGTTTQGAGASAVTVAIDRHEDATLSGIQSVNRVLNGSATQAVTITGSSFGITGSETSATTNLQLPSSPEQKYPLGGTISAAGTVTTSGVTSSTQTYTRQIAFDGTSIMTVTMTAGTSTTVCKVNLASPGAAPTCS